MSEVPVTFLSEIKSLFDSTGFVAVVTAVSTTLLAFIPTFYMEKMKNKHILKVERAKAFYTERIAALKRLIEFSLNLASIPDPEGDIELRHFSSVFEQFTKTIIYDAAFHTKEITAVLFEIEKMNNSIEYAYLDNSENEVREFVNSNLGEQAYTLRTLAQNELQGIGI